MELVAPGMDIVGFEHVASTDEQKAAVEKAKAKLTDVLRVFKLPAAASARPKRLTSRSRKEVHHDGDEDHDEDEKEGQATSIRNSTPRTRSPASARNTVTGLDTVYFANFAGAQLLNVNVDDRQGPDASTDDPRQADARSRGIM